MNNSNQSSAGTDRRIWTRPLVQRMSAGSAEDGAKPDFVDSGQKPS